MLDKQLVDKFRTFAGLNNPERYIKPYMDNQYNLPDYNTDRPDLLIPEYGRNVKNMIDFAIDVKNKEERNKVSHAIISVMSQLSPYSKEIEDFNHKLWDHLHILADFKLDVDSPYPLPAPPSEDKGPDKVEYPSGDIKYGHYGRYAEKWIEKCCLLEDSPERDEFTLAIANLMKRNYVNFNRNTVDDSLIKEQLTKLSNGKLVLKEGQNLIPTNEIQPVGQAKTQQKNNNRKKGNQNKKKRK